VSKFRPPTPILATTTERSVARRLQLVWGVTPIVVKNDERTGMLALRASVIQGINLGNGKINLINFFEGYPTKTVILDVSALSKVMNKVESISELLNFFTNSPLEKIKTN